MQRDLILLLVPAVLASCGPDYPAVVGDTPGLVDSRTVEAMAATEIAPRSSRQWTPPSACPQSSDPHRPTGSNCFGVLPRACGADRAFAYIGTELTAGTRGALDAIGAGATRYIFEGEGFDEDLRPDRLNVLVSDNYIVTAVDCF